MRFERIAKSRNSDSYPARLYLIFALLALFSTLGLDYAAARRGEKAYFFPTRIAPEKVPAAAVPLADSTRRFLETFGLSPDSVTVLKNKDGTPRITAQLRVKDYETLEPLLEEELREARAIFSKKKIDEEGLTSHSWRVRGPKDERFSLVFALLRPPTAEREKEVVAPAPPEGRVAIIIDDMGDSLEALEEICDLGQPVTISILPQSLYAEQTARIAHEKGLEVMLHLPGESLNHQEGDSSTAGLITTGMSEREIKSFVEESLSLVPYAVGVNNHMGSRITREEKVMRPVLEHLKSRGLFFLDSRTTAESIAFDLAREMGLRTAYRNVFLDNTAGVDFSRKKIIDLFRLSQKAGTAIGIGHPFPETLQALRENIHLLREYRVRPVFASEIVSK